MIFHLTVILINKDLVMHKQENTNDNKQHFSVFMSSHFQGYMKKLMRSKNVAYCGFVRISIHLFVIFSRF